MPKKIVLVSALALAAVPFGLVIDRYLSRGDRIRLEEEKERLTELGDAVLRFKMDRGRLPREPSEMVPGYVSEDLTAFRPDSKAGTRASILWDPEAGRLCWSTPFVIRGLVSRRESFSLELQDAPVVRDPLTGRNVFGQDAEQVLLSEDDVVVEAEHFQFMTYGWEIGESAEASGGCYIHIKEGVGDAESEQKIEKDPTVRSGDFYNVSRDRRPIEARCHFLAPREGEYFAAARTMAHRSHCSNILYLKVNDGERRQLGRNGTKPFVWLWHKVGRVRLKRGLNSLSFMTFQDDVKVDQAVFSADDLVLREDRSRTFGGGHRRRPTLPDGVPPATLSLSADTRALTEGKDPEILAYVRKNVPGAVRARLAVSLGSPAHRKRESARDIELAGTQELVKFPCRPNLPGPLERREYLLRCRLLVDLKAVGERTLVLSRGYDWSVLGPLPYMEAAQAGRPEEDLRPGESYSLGGRSFAWERFREEHVGRFGIMDFGVMFSGRTYHAMPNVALYAYTEVEAKEGGPYRLKAQGDDHIVVWVNGERAVTIAEKGPPIRTARETEIRLRPGRNRIIFRLNQKEHQWQAGIMIRTTDDKVADVKGVPFSGQGIAFYSMERWKGWSLLRWASPGRIELPDGPAPLVVETTDPAGKDKLALALPVSLDLSRAKRMRLRAENRGSGPVGVAVALTTSEEGVYHELPAREVAPGRAAELAFELGGAEWKTASSGWKHDAVLTGAGRAHSVTILVYHGGNGCRLALDGVGFE